MGTLAAYNLAALRAMHGLRAMVETGTATGEGTELARAAGFDPIHTIEIEPHLAAAARARFAQAPAVTVWEGDSRAVLPRILEALPPEPCLFWLDAHFPGAHTGAAYDAERDAGRRLPLVDEVRAIRAARPAARDVLLIDDARLYLPSMEYGARDEFSAAIADGTWPPIAGLARGIEWLREAYGATHGIVCDYAMQGVLMVFPRIDAARRAA